MRPRRTAGADPAGLAVRRRGKSPWLEEARKRPLETMLPCVAERIAKGEHPLEVWAQQQCVPLKTIGRKTKIDMYAKYRRSSFSPSM